MSANLSPRDGSPEGRNAPDEDLGDLLYSSLSSDLHVEHLAMSRLVGRLLAAEQEADPVSLWRELYCELRAHTEAEEQTLYREMMQVDSLRSLTGDLFDDHQVIVLLLSELGDVDPMSEEFRAKLSELESVLDVHFEREESFALPGAEEHIAADSLDRIVAAFETRKTAILDRLRIELSSA